MKKIAVVTGSRADYGLLKPLLVKIEKHEDFSMQLIVTAMHLSKDFGYTVTEIEKDGFPITKRIDCLLSSDSAVGISKSISLALIGFSDAFAELNPHLLILLGDRTEILAAAIAASNANIPIAHIHGGETTEGAVDESIRHSITKMSYWHFTSTDEYRNRVIQLGEDPSRVFNVGAIGIDSIKSLKLFSKGELEDFLKIEIKEKALLITYHPVTLEVDLSENQFKEILKALDSLENTTLIFTHANSDKDGKIINQMIEQFCKEKDNAFHYPSLGQLRYLSFLQYVNAVVGNSSSGIIEVPYFNKFTINIGDRQKGRISPKSVLDVNAKKEDISAALKIVFDEERLLEIKNQVQIHGKGDAVSQIMNVIENNLKTELKKSFFDVKFDSYE